LDFGLVVPSNALPTDEEVRLFLAAVPLVKQSDFFLRLCRPMIGKNFLAAVPPDERKGSAFPSGQ